MASENLPDAALDQKFTSEGQKVVASRLVREPGEEVTVQVKSYAEVDEYQEGLKKLILEIAPDAEVEIFGGHGGGSIEVRRPTWELNARSKIWVNIPPDFEVGEDGIPFTRVSVPELIGATAEYKQSMMSMLGGVPPGWTISPQGELVRASAGESTTTPQK